MREILFRGKRIDNGEWVEGYITEHTMIPRDEQPYIGWVIECRPKELYGHDWYEVDPETVGQYTGLTDKNGKRIFEGDVVQAHFRNNHSKQKFRVLFDDGMFLFDNNCVKVLKHEIYAMKVIGNIHDNKLEDFADGN